MTYNNLAGGRSKKSLKKRGARKSRRKGSKKLRKSKKAGQFSMTPEARIRRLGREIINYYYPGYTGDKNIKPANIDLNETLKEINIQLQSLWCGKRDGKVYYVNINKIGNTTYMTRFAKKTYNEGKDTVRNIMAEVNRLLVTYNASHLLHKDEDNELTHILNFSSENIDNVVADDRNCTNYYSNDGTENKPTFNRFAPPQRTESYDIRKFNKVFGDDPTRTSSIDSNDTTDSDDVKNRETEVRFNYVPNVRGGSRRRKSKKSKRTKKSRRSRRRH